MSKRVILDIIISIIFPSTFLYIFTKVLFNLTQTESILLFIIFIIIFISVRIFDILIRRK
jgi:hypothetical protein